VRQELAAAAGAHVRPEAIKNEQLKLHTFAQILAHKRAETRIKVEDCITALANHKDAIVERLEGLRAKVQARRDTDLAMPRRARASLLPDAAPAANLFAALPPTPGQSDHSLSPGVKTKAWALASNCARRRS
jgi:hypothetical protein